MVFDNIYGKLPLSHIEFKRACYCLEIKNIVLQLNFFSALIRPINPSEVSLQFTHIYILEILVHSNNESI